MCVCVADPGKYNHTPRLFSLSASSGVFEGEEVLYPARVAEGVMAMPFLQENLYAAQQPGNTSCEQCCISVISTFQFLKNLKLAKQVQVYLQQTSTDMKKDIIKRNAC